jgi:hypothetical protein
VWDAIVSALALNFTVVITGTTHSSALVNKVGRDIINMIPSTGVDGLDILIAFLRKAKMSVTSQSGPTLISLLCETPCYIMGHEADRHSKHENFLNTPTMFRSVPYGVYAGMNTEIALQDIYNFNNALGKADNDVDILYNQCHNQNKVNMHSLLHEEVNLYQISAEEMRREIIYGKPQG